MVQEGYPNIGRQFVKWRGPKINIDFQEIERKKAQRKKEYDQAAKFQDKHLKKMEKEYEKQERPEVLYTAPGEQGRLFDVNDDWHEKTGGTPPEPDWGKTDSEGRWGAKPIAEHSEAEKLTSVNEIAKKLGLPMQPGRQVAAWANKQHLPKAEGGQGTLFAPRKYR